MSQVQNITAQSFLGGTAEIRAANRQALFSFKGRVGRSMYWRFGILLGVVFITLSNMFDLPTRMGAFGFTVVGLLVCWIALAITVKRCHDRGRSGWFGLISLIPVIGSIWLLIDLGFLPGMNQDT